MRTKCIQQNKQVHQATDLQPNHHKNGTSRLNRVFNQGNMEDLDFSKMCSLKNGFILSSPHLDFIKSSFFYYRNVKSFHEIGSKNQA